MEHFCQPLFAVFMNSKKFWHISTKCMLPKLLCLKTTIIWVNHQVSVNFKFDLTTDWSAPLWRTNVYSTLIQCFGLGQCKGGMHGQMISILGTDANAQFMSAAWGVTVDCWCDMYPLALTFSWICAPIDTNENLYTSRGATIVYSDRGKGHIFLSFYERKYATR